MDWPVFIGHSDALADFVLSVFAVLASARKEVLLPGGWDEAHCRQKATVRILLTGSCGYHSLWAYDTAPASVTEASVGRVRLEHQGKLRLLLLCQHGEQRLRFRDFTGPSSGAFPACRNWNDDINNQILTEARRLRSEPLGKKCLSCSLGKTPDCPEHWSKVGNLKWEVQEGVPATHGLNQLQWHKL